MQPNIPRPSGSRPDGAAGNQSGLEYRLNTRPHLTSQETRRLRRERQVEQIHRLGARAVFELLQQLDRDHGLGRQLDRQLERFAGLDAGILAAVGGDRFAPAPLHVVGGQQ
jgi:hypothetical protein